MIEDKINSYVDIFEHPRVKMWFDEIARKDPLLFNVLVRDNSIHFSRIFNNSKKSENIFKRLVKRLMNKGDKEVSKYWLYTYKGLQIKIQTGKMGTLFFCKTITNEEDFKKDFSLGIAIINFLEEILISQLFSIK